MRGHRACDAMSLSGARRPRPLYPLNTPICSEMQHPDLPRLATQNASQPVSMTGQYSVDNP